MKPKWYANISIVKSAIENTTRQVSALTVRLELPLSLTMKYNAEPKLTSIRRMNTKTNIFNCHLVAREFSPARER